MDSFPNLKQGNLVDRVFGELKASILSGKIKRGEQFPPQDALAGEFGVSRTVIREAQKKLSSLGLVKSEQGRGTFVSTPDSSLLLDPMLQSLTLDKASTRELLEARYHIEKVVAKLAAARATAADIARLEGIIKHMQDSAAAGDLEGYAHHDIAFHKELALISQNALFCRILETLWDLNYRFLMSFTRTAGAIERAIVSHRQILEAVASSDSARAEQEMNNHMQDIIRATRRHYDLDIAI